MRLEPLVPGMEHAEEADRGAEMAGIASDLEQGRGAGLDYLSRISGEDVRFWPIQMNPRTR